MTEMNKKLDEISHHLDENILAVKGTLELIDASVTDDELRELLLKALERMDAIQNLSADLIKVLRNCMDRLGETRK